MPPALGASRLWRKQPPASRSSLLPPPRFDIRPKVGHELLIAAEQVGRLDVAEMPVIALAGLVIVTQNAFTGDDERQTVFEPMRRAPKGTRDAPYDDLDEGFFGKYVALSMQQLR